MLIRAIILSWFKDSCIMRKKHAMSFVQFQKPSQIRLYMSGERWLMTGRQIVVNPTLMRNR